MAILDILTFPDRFLKKTAKPVKDINAALQKIIDDMIETMYDAPGIGLASIQIGCDKSMIVYDIDQAENERSIQVLLNPVIIETEGEIVSNNEGCLSVPDLRSDVKRAASVIVEALDREGNPLKIEAHDHLAVVLQHEIDHLNGVLFLDRISTLKRELYKRHVKKQLKKNDS
ncbi:MAG: peptide deformylase [Desulfobacterium sp.]|nr:peptide deformylase [Desulfobacterium sp.]MBU3950253.1 peptide deformylase [Pseudomonadota bacterium]MBU4010913.1 peptide deformylase [Pseudomonadota bacterium]